MRLVVTVVLCLCFYFQFTSDVVGQNLCTGNCNTGQSTCYYDTLSTSTATLTVSLEGIGMCCTGFQNGNSTNYNCAQMFITVPPG
ncbi:MAG: hypothetical protein HKN09_00305, partial [Saprospiraceae bacterium]|nr:hypothetical protein [Saprospiraceae bacterium]